MSPCLNFRSRPHRFETGKRCRLMLYPGKDDAGTHRGDTERCATGRRIYCRCLFLLGDYVASFESGAFLIVDARRPLLSRSNRDDTETASRRMVASKQGVTQPSKPCSRQSAPDHDEFRTRLTRRLAVALALSLHQLRAVEMSANDKRSPRCMSPLGRRSRRVGAAHR